MASRYLTSRAVLLPFDLYYKFHSMVFMQKRDQRGGDVSRSDIMKSLQGLIICIRAADTCNNPLMPFNRFFGISLRLTTRRVIQLFCMQLVIPLSVIICIPSFFYFLILSRFR